MPTTDDRMISQLTTVQINESTLFEVAAEDQSSSTGYSSGKAALSAIGSAVNNSIEYTQALNTVNKTIIGAINEILAQAGGYTEVVGTLTAGQTSITLSDASILTTSTLDFYTDIFGVSPTSVTVATGSVTLAFEAQSADMSVKVRVS